MIHPMNQVLGRFEIVILASEAAIGDVVVVILTEGHHITGKILGMTGVTFQTRALVWIGTAWT